MVDKNTDPNFDPERMKREEKQKQMELEKAERELQEQEHIQAVEKDILEWAKTKEKRVEKIKEDLGGLDKQLRTGLSLILSEYAESFTFNQHLLEDLVPIIVKRSKILKKLK